MPSEQMEFMPDEKLMKAHEIIEIAGIFKEMGVEKVRLTGGEPTLRKDLLDIVTGLKDIGLTPSMTTNAALLHRSMDDLEELGMRDLNISIDSLQREKFKRIAQRWRPSRSGAKIAASRLTSGQSATVSTNASIP